jgi:protein-disulfide isomerase
LEKPIVFKRPLITILPLLAVLFLAAACGPAAAGEAAQQSPSGDVQDMIFAEDSREDGSDASGESVEETGEENMSSAQAVPQSGETLNGVAVGFTAEGRPYRGSPDAVILMEEFSDYQCPFCSRFTEQTMPTLLENQIADGDVQVVYYDFPLESIHPQALAAANAARCAGEQGAAAYWQMHDLLYQNAGDWGISDPQPIFESLAGQLNIDAGAFAECQSELRYEAEIRADIDHGVSRGVRSTPSFFLNEQPLIGAQPITAFNQAIAMVLEGQQLAQAPTAEPAEPQSPLTPPPVAPTPAAIQMDTFAAEMGDPDAPVTIVEFTDYQCPFCQSYASQTLPSLVADKIATGEVHYILKDLPLDSIHPNARPAAVAARCAGQQGKYWEMHDALFESQSDWSGEGASPQQVFLDLAVTLQLDRDAFEACLDNDDVAQAVQSDVDEALSLGADSTPFFFVDGLPIPGAQPLELFEFAIAEAKEGRLADAYVPPEPDLEEAYAIGDPAAPVTIIEYTDYQCPFCSRHFEQTFGQIKENYVDTGQVYYVFKDFPLTNIHPQAPKAAEAARCAGEQAAYLEMHDRLFIDQAEWAGSSEAVDIFKAYAGDLGLDASAFAECLDSGRHEAIVAADFQEGTQMGINGTPAFVINGYTMAGAQPYAVFEDAIEQFLSESG